MIEVGFTTDILSLKEFLWNAGTVHDFSKGIFW